VDLSTVRQPTANRLSLIRHEQQDATDHDTIRSPQRTMSNVESCDLAASFAPRMHPMAAIAPPLERPLPRG
jgi:hypothetical protein